MPASSTGLFESLRRLGGTALEMAQVRLELLVADLELEKLRLIDFALWALLGLLLIGLGLVLLVGLVLLLLWEQHRLPAMLVLTLLFLGGGFVLLRAARRRLHDGDAPFAASTAELARDRAALGRGD
jgi:uncharacterized membrane protein YqjE